MKGSGDRAERKPNAAALLRRAGRFDLPALFGLALAAALLFRLLPGIDLWAAELLYDPEAGFFLKHSLFARVFYEGIRVGTPILVVALVIGIGVGLVPVVRRKVPLVPRPPVLAFVLLSIVLGPGLVVNAVLKDNWGRARPSQVVEFGGDKDFTPALVFADQCARNCSFVAGHPSMMFVLLAPALLLVGRRRRLAVAGVVVLGAAAGLGRMMQGGHFLSDVVFSGVFTFLVVGVLYQLMIRRAFPPARWTGWAWRGPPRAVAGRLRLPVTGSPAVDGLLVTIALATIGVAFVDRPLALWLKTFDQSLVADVFRVVTQLGVSTGYLVLSAGIAIGCLLASRFGAGVAYRRWAYLSARFFVSLGLATLPINVLKILIGRARPRLLFREDLYGFHPFAFEADFWSMPSGHAATAVAAAVLLSFLAPALRVYLLAAAALVCLSRIVLTAHYFSDTVVGAYVAALLAALIWKASARYLAGPLAAGRPAE